ncbi:formate dehydrogenase major subunit/formate dehydrogenase alpha subunit [Dehalogenimonas formicexedens]|uniref:Formate dehydrogenase major subunit/formate dehydrogenase alpha subunit n=1 Tax=Dehalogenimonas formicexedens TaxID=1839801 RepID=A0A1P8F7P9_9CHLR|nr:formate dehydrogenase subunit alpha [Dehalogenimonas formicexedens]APV44480.1 formate dehydrogenase major subunit/formate dehydrogenase alpha subunit [Dehalogenimonas formicexedens]
MIELRINDQVIEAAEGQTVLEAARQAGIYIPSLCYSPDLKPYGGCRMCIVEIEKMRGLPTACTTPVAAGMVIRTETPALTDARRTVLDLLLAEHPLDCASCVKDGRCELQDAAKHMGITVSRLPVSARIQAIDDSNPFFKLDRNKCILCARCTRACDEITGNNAIEIVDRGYGSKVGTVVDRPLTGTNCASCGECVTQCPVAALVPKDHVKPDGVVSTVCPYCGVGCGIKLELSGGKIVSVSGDTGNPSSRGRLCVKGRFGIKDFVHHADRLTTPLLKRDGQFVESAWDEALEYACSRLYQFKPGEVAVIASAKATNEENYLIQKFARAVLKTNNVDHSARLCHAPTVAGLAAAFGSGAMTNSIGDLNQSGCFFVLGANTSETHPVIGFGIKQAVKNGAKLIVANPVRIPLVRYADIFLQHHPGTDVMLLSAMCKIIIDEELLDRNFIDSRTEGYESLAKSLRKFDLDHAAAVTGVALEDIRMAARLYAGSKTASILYAMGITQHRHGTDNVSSVANLAMLTGNLGKPGGGVNPLRGQNNVQGACDMGALPDVFTGYQKVSDEVAKTKFEAAWGVSLPSEPGLTLLEIIDAIDRKKIKALYVVGENLMLSDPDINRLKRALEKLELLVVQDIFMNETAEMAHAVLPSTTFAEKEGTFTNTERRVQRLRKAVNPVGFSKPDWWITAQLGKRLCGKGFGFSGPEGIFEEITTLTPSYAGISYDRLDQGGLQWPCPSPSHPGTPILYVGSFTRGKGVFKAVKFVPPAELPDDTYPFILTTGRSLYHFHTGTMTRRVKGLNALQPTETLEISGVDASNLGISDGESVRVTSRRGSVTANAVVSKRPKPGTIFMTFHFPETATNILTNPARDPVAKIPELKVAAVKIEKV